jgi:hypothetical protein
MMAERGIYIEDYKKLLGDLKSLSPDLQKDLLKTLKKVVRPLQNKARDFVPGDPALSGWRTVAPTYTSAGWENDKEHRGRASDVRWVWDSKKMRNGIKISTAKSSQERAPGQTLYKVNALALTNKSVPGIIYELAEPDTPRKGAAMKSRNPNAPDDFRKGIARKGDHGHRPRLIYKVAMMHGKQAQDDIQDVLDKKLYAFVKRGS